MPLHRVHAYDDEHYATLVIRAEGPEQASSIAVQFVAMMHLGYYPANHEREFPEVVRIESAASYFDAADPFLPVVESVEAVERVSGGASARHRQGCSPSRFQVLRHG
jgi:hypothetical protein